MGSKRNFLGGFCMDRMGVVYLETAVKKHKNAKVLDDFIMNIARTMNFQVKEVAEIELRQIEDGCVIEKQTVFDGCSTHFVFFQINKDEEKTEGIPLEENVGFDLWEQDGDLLKKTESVTYYNTDTGLILSTSTVVDGEPLFLTEAKYIVIINYGVETLQHPNASRRAKNRLLDYFDEEVWFVRDMEYEED